MENGNAPIAAPPLKAKIVVIGEYSVGKTALTHRFVNKAFDGRTEPTIGAAFQTRTIPISGSNQTIKFEIWDTAGSERYRSLMPMYYRDATAAIICYDVTNARTFDRVPNWLEQFRKHNEGNHDEVVIALAGTKADLALEDPKARGVRTEDAQAFTEKEDLIFYETSAKTDIHVLDLFTSLARRIEKVHASKVSKPQRPNNYGGRVRMGGDEAGSQFGARRRGASAVVVKPKKPTCCSK